MSKLPKKLEQFLFVVPYVATRRDGVLAKDLAEMLSINLRELHRLLDEVAMVGAPDGTPDELVEIYVEGDRVHVALPQRFVRPPRFTIEEMTALLLALAPLRGLPRLEARVAELTSRFMELASTRASEDAAELEARVGTVHSESPDLLEVFEAAAESRELLSVRYYTAGRDAVSERVLQVGGLLLVRGIWYIVDAEDKVFRVDRFAAAEGTGRFGEALHPDLAAHQERLESRNFGGESAVLATVKDAGEVEPRDGTRSRRVEGQSAHLARIVRQARGLEALTSPAALREAIGKEAEAMAARYGAPAPKEFSGQGQGS